MNDTNKQRAIKIIKNYKKIIYKDKLRIKIF